jgi:hypothetical protein
MKKKKEKKRKDGITYLEDTSTCELIDTPIANLTIAITRAQHICFLWMEVE